MKSRWVTCLTVFGLLLLTISTAAAAAPGNTISIMSRRGDGVSGDNASQYVSVSGSGRYVVFSSLASNLSTADTNSVRDIYLYDRDVDGNSIIDEEGFTEVYLISQIPSASPSAGNGLSYFGSISSEGRFISFASLADNLTSNDLNGVSDIFVVDVANLAADPVRISVSASGVEGNAASGYLLSTYGVHPDSDVVNNGGYPMVVFESNASNLDDAFSDTNAETDIFVRDAAANTTTLLTRGCSIVGGVYDCMLFSAPANGASYHPSFSEDGRYVAFVTEATNIFVIGGDPSVNDSIYSGSTSNVILLDRDYDNDGIYDEFNQSGAVKYYLVSRRPGDYYPATGSWTGIFPYTSQYPDVTYDSYHNMVYVVFLSYANDLIYNADSGLNDADQNNAADVFLYTLDAGSYIEDVRLISVDSNGNQGESASLAPAIASQYIPATDFFEYTIAYHSYANNLVAGDTNTGCALFNWSTPSTTNCPDVFVIDSVNYLTWRASQLVNGLPGQDRSTYPAVSANGQYVFFSSQANLTGDYISSPPAQIYMRDQGYPPGNPYIEPPYAVLYGPTTSTDANRQDFYVFAMHTLTIESVSLGGSADFEIIDNTCTGQIIEGTACNITVQFNGTLLNSSATLYIDVNDDNDAGHVVDRTLQVAIQGYIFGTYLPMLRTTP